MPTHKSKQHHRAEFRFFNDTGVMLHLLVIAFLTLSALLTVFVIKQQEELTLYRQAQAILSSK